MIDSQRKKPKLYKHAVGGDVNITTGKDKARL